MAQTAKTLTRTTNTVAQAAKTVGQPSPNLMTPSNHALLLIDYEGQMIFPLKSQNMNEFRDNVGIVAGASKIFNLPVILTTITAVSFSGPVLPELTEVFPYKASTYLDRTSINSWEDPGVYKAITSFNKKRIVFAGLWTSACIAFPVLSALDEGYEAYVITDACGDVSEEAHLMAVHRMIAAGARTITSIQYLLELQRDWARMETYNAVMDLLKNMVAPMALESNMPKEC
jgi:nicotinamidase-related amidase